MKVYVHTPKTEHGHQQRLEDHEDLALITVTKQAGAPRLSANHDGQDVRPRLWSATARELPSGEQLESWKEECSMAETLSFKVHFRSYTWKPVTKNCLNTWQNEIQGNAEEYTI